MAKKNNNKDASLTVVLPGDNVTEHITFASSTSSSKESSIPKLGTGLRFDHSTRQVYATTAGRFEKKNNNVYFIRQNLHRYRPALEDRVLGIVEERAGQDGNGGDYFRININAAHPAILSNLSFEGATKRNRPALQTGQLVYARVSDLNHGLLEVSLSCILGPHDAGVPRKDWMTNEGCYGELRGGTVCRISTGLARELLQPQCLVLNELAQAQVAFEVAAGVNGFLWIHSLTPDHTVAIQNAIKNSEVLSEEQVRAMVKSLVYTVEKQLLQKNDAMTEE
jgi:exosome complex component RRP40